MSHCDGAPQKLSIGVRFQYLDHLSLILIPLYADCFHCSHVFLWLCFAGSCFWVAVLEGNVVGIVAARGNEEDNVVELRRMSVDSSYRGKGIAKALGRKVLEFAMLNHYSSIVLGTTAVKIAAHKLYESLGFRHVGVVEHHTVPGMTHSLLERMFFRLRYHRYCLQLREE